MVKSETVTEEVQDVHGTSQKTWLRPEIDEQCVVKSETVTRECRMFTGPARRLGRGWWAARWMSSAWSRTRLSRGSAGCSRDQLEDLVGLEDSKDKTQGWEVEMLSFSVVPGSCGAGNHPECLGVFLTGVPFSPPGISLEHALEHMFQTFWPGLCRNLAICG